MGRVLPGANGGMLSGVQILGMTPLQEKAFAKIKGVIHHYEEDGDVVIIHHHGHSLFREIRLGKMGGLSGIVRIYKYYNFEEKKPFRLLFTEKTWNNKKQKNGI